VPACSSSPIPAAAHAVAPAALAGDQCCSLLADLAQLSDPRRRRGRRHALGAVLAVAVCAVLAGARSLVAIGEWAADAPGQVLAALGTRRDPLTGAFRPPTEATVRRVLGRVDPDALGQAIGRWLAAQQPLCPTGRRHRHLPGRSGRSRSTARPCAAAATTKRQRCICSRRWTTPATPSWARPTWSTPPRDHSVPAAAAAAGPHCHRGHCRCAPHPACPRRLAGRRQAGRLRTDREGQPAQPHRQLSTLPGARSPSPTTPMTVATVASSSAACRSSPWLPWTSPTRSRPSVSPAGSGRLPAGGGGP
jgi:DDE_Tnp_1-associated